MDAGQLMGPDGALQRMRELQQRIQSFAPTPIPAGAPTFAGTLSGLMPVDPTQAGTADISSLTSLADAASQKYGLDPKVFQSLIKTESGWNPDAKSNKGAMGLTQLMPSTASALGVQNPFDPAQSIDGGAKYLREMLDRFGNDYTKAVAAYNAGPAAVSKANGIPPFQETVAYVRKVMGG
jgi:soluble lytic murein transglycosylase-like protein